MKKIGIIWIEKYLIIKWMSFCENKTGSKNAVNCHVAEIYKMKF
jgi:hypothetical protein